MIEKRVKRSESYRRDWLESRFRFFCGFGNSTLDFERRT